MIVQDKIPQLQQKIKDNQNTESNKDESQMNNSYSNTAGSGETYALKIINKSVLHPIEIDALKGESSILRDLVGQTNIVQFMNIFETKKYAIIQMEHLKGMQMLRELRARISHVKENLKSSNQHNDIDQYSDHNNDCKNKPSKLADKKLNQKNREEQSENSLGQQEQEALMFQFGDPLKFWRHQLNQKENKPVFLDKQIYKEEEASKIMKAIMNGLNNIHERNYIHRDMKPENILLALKDQSMEDEVKIIDFGLSAKQKIGVKDNHQEKIGTVLYMAPEQISSKKYCKKIDIYAAGIILYLMLTGNHPLYIKGPIFPDCSQTLKMKVASIGPQEWYYPSHMSSLAKDLIFKLCQISQTERYDAKRAMMHPWITRQFNDQIPLTAKEKGMRDELEQTMQRSLRSVMFLAIIKQKKSQEDNIFQSQLSFDQTSKQLSVDNRKLDHLLSSIKTRNKNSVKSHHEVDQTTVTSKCSDNSLTYQSQSLLNLKLKQFTNSEDEQGKIFKTRQVTLSEQFGISKSYLEKIFKYVNTDFTGNKKQKQNKDSMLNTPRALQVLYSNLNSKTSQKSFYKNGLRELKSLTNWKQHNLNYNQVEKFQPNIFSIDEQLCGTPKFDNGEVNQFTIGDDSLKPYTEQRKTELMIAQHTSREYQDQSDEQANTKSSIQKLNNTTCNRLNSNQRGSMKKHSKLNNIGVQISIKKSKQHKGEPNSSTSVKKPKQMQFEYDEGLSNIINGLDSYKAQQSLHNNNKNKQLHLQMHTSSTNLNQSDLKNSDELQSTPTISSQCKNKNAKTVRAVVEMVPVPFNIDEDQIRSTDNSMMIGNGISQRQTNYRQHPSRSDKMQAKVNQSSAISIQNQQGFTQVHPVFQAQSLNNNVSSTMRDNIQIDLNQQQQMNGMHQMNMVESGQQQFLEEDNQYIKRKSPVRNKQESAEQLKFKIELRSSNYNCIENNLKPSQSIIVNPSQQISRNVTNITDYSREGYNASQMVTINDSNHNKYANQLKYNHKNINGRNFEQARKTMNQIEVQNVRNQKESNTYTAIYKSDNSNSISRMSELDIQKEFNKNMDGCEMFKIHQKKTSRQDRQSYQISPIYPLGNLQSAKHSLQTNNDNNKLLSIDANSNVLRQSSNHQQIQIREVRRHRGYSEAQNVYKNKHLKMNANQNFIQKSKCPPHVHQQQQYHQQTPMIQSNKLSLLPPHQAQTKPQKSQQYFGRLAGVMLVPGAADSSYSYNDKKDGQDSHRNCKRDQKSKYDGGKFNSRNYEIGDMITSAHKKELDFQKQMNLRKQLTSTNMQTTATTVKKDMRYITKNRINDSSLAPHNSMIKIETQPTPLNFSMPVQHHGVVELTAEQQLAISDFNDQVPSNYESDVAFTTGASKTRFYNSKSQIPSSVANSNRASVQNLQSESIINRPPSVSNVNPSMAVYNQGTTCPQGVITRVNNSSQMHQITSGSVILGSNQQIMKTRHVPIVTGVHIVQKTAMHVMKPKQNNKVVVGGNSIKKNNNKSEKAKLVDLQPIQNTRNIHNKIE